jgi:uncharacterized damage-inducible protein DinB
MPDHPYCNSIRSQKEFFDRGTKCFEEKDSTFAPKSEMYTVAQHVAHTAMTIEWFVDGAFNPKGFPVDFETGEKIIREYASLKAARDYMDRATKHALDVIGSKSAAELSQPIAPGIMGGAPRSAIFEAMADHTAHHRGALTVYARLLNKVPAMPYMDV